MSEATPESTENLETITESGRAPKSRLNSAASGYRIARRMIDADDKRALSRKNVQGQIDGNAPYDQEELKRLGQSNRSNFNSRTAEGIRDSRKTSYYELLLEVDTFIDIEIPAYDNAPESPVDYGQIIAEKFSDMLMEWPGFWYNMMLHQEQFVTWGVGNCYWLNELDWRFRASRVGSYLVPDDTLATLEDFEGLTIRDSERIHKLWAYISTPERKAASKAAGWNTDLLEEIIFNVIKTNDPESKYGLSDWESVQSQLKDNDLAFGLTIFPKIQYYHLLYVEFDGSISHMIVHENSEFSDKATANGKMENWLFRKVGRFASWDQFTCPFFANIGEGSYHSIRGMGPKIFAHSVINDRLLNTMLDGAMASATILLQPSNDPQKERIRMVRVGPFSVMPSGYSVVPQGSFRPDLNGLVGIKNLLDANLNQNVGMYRPDVSETEKSPQGQNQLELRNRASKEAKLERSDINNYYLAWDRLFREVARRVLNPQLTALDPGGKEAKAFIRACRDAGVPAQYLKIDQLKIRARRAVGFGSPVMRSVITADILGVSPYLDEKGKDNAIRDYIAARGGERAVKRYKPVQNRNAIPTNDTSIAALENNDLREGSECAVGVEQPHVIHLQTHMSPLVEISDAYQQGQVDPEKIYPYLSAALKHSSMHLDMIARDPARENEYRGFMSIFTDLVKLHATVERQVKQIAKQRQAATEEQAATMQAAQASQMDPAIQVKMSKMQGDLQLKAQKQAEQMRLNEIKMQHNMQLKDMLARHQMTMDAMKGSAR